MKLLFFCPIFILVSFSAVDDELTFDHGEISKVISIPIIDDLESEKDESFAIELYNPTGGAQLGKHNRTVVTIINDDGRFEQLINIVLIF